MMMRYVINLNLNLNLNIHILNLMSSRQLRQLMMNTLNAHSRNKRTTNTHAYIL